MSFWGLAGIVRMLFWCFFRFNPFRDVYIGRLVEMLSRVGLWPIQGCFRVYIGLLSSSKGPGEPEDPGTRGPEDKVTRGPMDQGTKETGDQQRTSSGPKDQESLK